MSRVSNGSVGFVYVAATARGGRRLGMRQAASERALAAQLRRDRLVLMRTWRLPAWLAIERKLKLKDQAALNTQLAQLLARGVPLVEALEVAASVVTPNTAPIIDRMREQVAGGSSFSDACENAGTFDEVTVAVYRSAERSGDLAGSCYQLAETIRRRLAVAGKAATLLVYPAIVMTISILVSVVMLIFIMPRVLGSLIDQNIKIPIYSRAMLSLGMFLRDHGMIVLAVVGGLIVLAVVLRRQVAALILRLARRAPLVGEVMLAQESARFFGVMAAMTRSGVPLADALGVSVRAIENPTLRRQIVTLRTRLIEGGILRLLIDAVDALPLATRKLLIAAERAGDLESAFDSLSKDLTDEVDRRSERALAALEPMLIVLMFLMIGSMVLAMMIPMLTAASQIE